MNISVLLECGLEHGSILYSLVTSDGGPRMAEIEIDVPGLSGPWIFYPFPSFGQTNYCKYSALYPCLLDARVSLLFKFSNWVFGSSKSCSLSLFSRDASKYSALLFYLASST